MISPSFPRAGIPPGAVPLAAPIPTCQRATAHAVSSHDDADPSSSAAPSASTAHVPLPPERSPPLTPTPIPSSHASLLSSAAAAAARGRAISPPTPAPSPQPHSRVVSVEDTLRGSDEGGEGSGRQGAGWRPRGPPGQATSDDDAFFLPRISTNASPDLIQSLRRRINSLSPSSRQALLTHLINDSVPSALSPLMPLITPRLKRDFLKTLPLELAFHVLSFVDDVKTLARASGVSRFWRALLEDEATWKRMCWKSGFGAAPLPPSPSLQDSAGLGRSRIRHLEFGQPDPDQFSQEDDLYTPAGRERRGTLDRGALAEFAARAELFDLPPSARASGGWARETDRHEDEEQEGGDGREGAGSWSAAPILPGVSAASATAEEAEDPAATAEGMGLGFANSLVPTMGASRASGLAGRRGARVVTPVVVPQAQASALDSTPADLVTSLPPPSTSTLVSPPMFSLPNSTPSPASVPLATSQSLHSNLASYASTSPSSSSHRYPRGYAPVFSPSQVPQVRPPAASSLPRSTLNPFSYKTHFKRAYLTESSWLRGPGRLLSTQMSADDGVVTSLGFDSEWIVVGMATSKVHVFDARDGRYVRTLEGHELGVWCLTLVSKDGGRRESDEGLGTGKGRAVDDPYDDAEEEQDAKMASPLGPSSFGSRARGSTTRSSDFFPGDPASGSGPHSAPSFFPHPTPRRRRSFPSSSASSSPPHHAAPEGGMGLGAGGPTGDSAQQAGVCGTARGWGQRGAVVVSGGCDREVRVWEVETGKCLHILRGHTSTVRCMRVLDGRPIAVSGSRDATLRVWNIETGEMVHLLSGHEHSVRCIEIAGNKVVSGSYDATCRLWDVDTGQCLHVFRGHIHQIYAVAFDGIRVVTGSLDSTVRIWSAETGELLALLQGHTSLVGQLQLDPRSNVLVTGGSDGRVIVFSLSTFETLHRLCAHDNSVTCLQVDERFIVTGGNDGRIKLWDFKTGHFVRELADPCDAVWRVVFRDDKCVTLCRRENKTLMDVRTFRPSDEELFGEA
ncbi:hypothetical protein JCM21900_004508 [Sporobolomyces salmonicolor]